MNNYLDYFPEMFLYNEGEYVIPNNLKPVKLSNKSEEKAILTLTQKEFQSILNKIILIRLDNKTN